ncbi:MAG: hypothetical protein WCT42_02460 [Candidatus Paceibacterota bacterium]|jgi:hypothetical protein
MITKIKNIRRSRQNYISDFDYEGDGIIITNRQKERLISLYNYNIQDDDDRYNRIEELSNLTSTEAEDIIFQFESATWH